MKVNFCAEKKQKDLGHPVNDVSNIIDKNILLFSKKCVFQIYQGCPINHILRKKTKTKNKQKKEKTKNFNMDLKGTCKELTYTV